METGSIFFLFWWPPASSNTNRLPTSYGKSTHILREVGKSLPTSYGNLGVFYPHLTGIWGRAISIKIFFRIFIRGAVRFSWRNATAPKAEDPTGRYCKACLYVWGTLCLIALFTRHSTADITGTKARWYEIRSILAMTINNKIRQTYTGGGHYPGQCPGNTGGRGILPQAQKTLKKGSGG